jgi:hypothetical protein
MLMLSPREARTRQEAAMSTIHSDVKVERLQTMAVRRDSDSFSNFRRVGSPKDQEVMHAWSIGITRDVTVRTNDRRKEECPPEVYLG